jgi:magnesium transporter
MIRYYAQQEGRLAELEGLAPSCWVNISPPIEKSELISLSETLSIPEDFLTDSLDIDERSRYDREDDIRLIVVNTAFFNDSELENEAIYITVPIGIILTSDNMITISPKDNAVINRFLENRIRHFDLHDERKFTLQLFEQIVLHYLDCLKKLNLKRHLIENELYDSARNSELKQLLRIEKSLVYFVNSLSSNELVNMKLKRTDFLNIRDDEDLSDIFEDIIIDNSQALEMANVHTNILSGTMEAYASIVSNNLNSFIQRLTIVTIILMVPTLVASFYGMNLQNLPLQDSPYAFYIILIASLVFSVLLVWFFRRKHLF